MHLCVSGDVAIAFVVVVVLLSLKAILEIKSRARVEKALDGIIWPDLGAPSAHESDSNVHTRWKLSP